MRRSELPAEFLTQSLASTQLPDTGATSFQRVFLAGITLESLSGPPTVTGVVPGASATATQAFTFCFTSGWQDLGVVNVLVNFWLDGGNSCYPAYSRPANALYPINKAGDGYAGSMPLNGSGTLSHSQCIINGAGSSVSGSGNTIALTLNMTFRASFAGTKIIYTAARDVVENNSDWQRMGVWSVPGAAQTRTTAVAGMNQRLAGRPAAPLRSGLRAGKQHAVRDER